MYHSYLVWRRKRYPYENVQPQSYGRGHHGQQQQHHYDFVPYSGHHPHQQKHDYYAYNPELGASGGRHRREAQGNDYYSLPPPPPPPPPSYGTTTKPSFPADSGEHKSVLKKSFNSFFVPTPLTDVVLEVKDKHGSSYEPAEAWKADCNAKYGSAHGFKFGWITGVGERHEGYEATMKTLDFNTCTGPTNGDDSENKKDDYPPKPNTFQLDLNEVRVIDLTPEEHPYLPSSDCPRGFLLTALWAEDYDWKHVKYGKCVELEDGLVDFMTCANFEPEPQKEKQEQHGYYKDHQPTSSYNKKLAVIDCPRAWAAVGLRRSYQGIDALRCCKIVPPHPLPPPPPHPAGYGYPA
ncbi:unnamed protein product [Notodromas monacha]|uniref:Uncharacterized protein n=1 Tax=Notodromas monacha TaxID=399045 RepID=A0A7R9BYY8_9CRUS|nr:unnamed protein product [Notodromas monacha]CAG0923131.1 unnamed protein product [Notodromas monacha]